ETTLLSNPGCYPTTILSGLAPLVQHKLIAEKTIMIDAKTGGRGAGKGVSQATHFAETNDNIKIYKANAHQHTPEIEQGLHHWNTEVEAVTFTPHLAPMTRGIMATMYATVKDDTSAEKLINLYKESYQNDYFVRIREA